MRAGFRSALVALLGLFAAGAAQAQISRTVDRVQYSIHVNVAAQLDLAELRLYLAEADELLQKDEGAADVACCMSLQAGPPRTPPNRPDSESLVVFGTPGDGLDVIENLDEFNALNGRRAIVQTIDWCGNYNPSLIGCAETPGDSIIVALDAGPEALALLIAHERGHNANLSHRDEPCALMAPSLGSMSGCLTTSECTAYRWLAGSTTQGSCDCMGPSIGDPVDANGAACTRDGVAGVCHDEGLCSPPPANDVCAQATPLSGAVALLAENYSASLDGGSSCGAGSADVWYRYTPACTGRLEIDLCDADPDLQLSVQRSCAAGGGNELICSNDCAAPAAGCRPGGSCATVDAQSGYPMLLRVASQTAETGPFVLRTRCQPGSLLDSDGDGISDFLDNCAHWANAAQADADGNGIGNACECGDQNGDGQVDANDLIAINLATYTPALATPLCDTTNDAACDVRDIIGANLKIFGQAAYCSRYPPP